MSAQTIGGAIEACCCEGTGGGGILKELTTWSWFVSLEQLVDEDWQDIASIRSYWYGPCHHSTINMRSYLGEAI